MYMRRSIRPRAAMRGAEYLHNMLALGVRNSRVSMRTYYL